MDLPSYEFRIDQAGGLVAPVRRNRVERLEAAALELPQVDLATTHHLAGNVYARSVVIPAGVVATGAVHKKDHVCVVQGDVSVLVDGEVRRLTGQHILVARAGTKRACYAHADTVWTALCHTTEKDIEAIEADLVEQPERLQTRNPAIGFAQQLESLPCHSE